MAFAELGMKTHPDPGLVLDLYFIKKVIVYKADSLKQIPLSPIEFWCHHSCAST